MIQTVILVIGREILRGRTQDTNSATLAWHLTGLGYEVVRIVACDDDLAAITREITRATEDGATLILTMGGLGPTDDDLTLRALAEAGGRPLILDPEARRLVASRYAELHRGGAVEHARLTPEREKMARIPQGALALPNPVGAAPGVWLEVGSAVWAALPGVPAEMSAVLETALLPKLAQRQPGATYAEERITTQTRDESALASILRRIGREVPEVFLKSHPTHFGRDVRLQVVASTWAPDRSTAESRLARTRTLLRNALGEAPPMANSPDPRKT
jgi:molybdenum cofactor synthesis domain-containing protein